MNAASRFRPSVGVLVTNYDTWALAQRCLEHARRFSPDVDEVLVVDDGSPTPPPRDFDLGAPLVVNAKNLGLAASLNRGLHLLGTDVAVLFDSDAFPLAAFGAPLREAFLREERLAIAGFRTVDGRGRATASWEPEPDALGLILGQRLDALRRRLRPPHGRGPICVYTCAMAVRREAILQLGGFDEGFDWLDLDHDLCMRATRSGWRVAVLPELLACHEGGGAPQRVAQRVERFYKSRWRLLRKFGRIRRPALARALILARLRIERALLWTGGRLGGGRRLQEKAASRGELIARCRSDYLRP